MIPKTNEPKQTQSTCKSANQSEKDFLPHDVLALKFQSTWMVPSNDPFLQKQTSEKAPKPNSNDSNISICLVYCEILLNIFANQRKEDYLATPFFAKHTFGAKQSKFLSSFSIFVAFL